MTSNLSISCTLDTTNSTANLGFELWVDEKMLFDTDHVKNKQQVLVEISDDESEHELRFVMKNKTQNHTQIDEAGSIIADANLIVTELAFDQIQLGHMVTEKAVYTHNFNGTGEATQDEFHGEMGCNGTVSLKFSTPVYLWLLENM